jgi:ubiquinone/menaquinone biosynthesis C-methylase UbiE
MKTSVSKIQNMKSFPILNLIVVLLCAQADQFALAGISYEQGQRADQYAKDQYKNAPNYYLAAKGVRSLLSKMTSAPSQKSKALDFGCGPGTLSAFYHDLGFQVTGVDISNAMISEGKKNFPLIDFKLVQKGKLPFNSGEFDAVFTSFVLLEMGDKNEIVETLREIRRVSKEGAPLIVVTTSENIYKYKQYSFVAARTDFPENERLISGHKVKLQLRSLDFAFEDYFWSDSDYRSFFKESGFHKVILESPLGTTEDEALLNIKWLSEKTVSPLSVYWVQ